MTRAPRPGERREADVCSRLLDPSTSMPRWRATRRLSPRASLPIARIGMRSWQERIGPDRLQPSIFANDRFQSIGAWLVDCQRNRRHHAVESKTVAARGGPWVWTPRSHQRTRFSAKRKPARGLNRNQQRDSNCREERRLAGADAGPTTQGKLLADWADNRNTERN